MATIKNNRVGHAARLREEITRYTNVMDKRTIGFSATDNYIQSQIELVLNGIYETEGEENPDTIDPKIVRWDYYLESILKYGTLCRDYEIDIEPDVDLAQRMRDHGACKGTIEGDGLTWDMVLSYSRN
jgi:hypothetical protein